MRAGSAALMNRIVLLCAIHTPPMKAKLTKEPRLPGPLTLWSSLDSEVFRTVPPYLLIASTALSGVTFSSLKNSAEVPG